MPPHSPYGISLYLRAVSFGRLLLIAIALLLPGCGYRLAAGDLRDAGAIAIVTPRNEAGEPGLDRIVADALRRELLRRSGARLAETPGTADVVVTGRVIAVETASRSVSSVVLVLEYETVVAIELQAARGEQVLVAATRLEESERHLASADVEAQRRNRDEAVRRVASLLAARFMDLLGDETHAAAAPAAPAAAEAPAAAAPEAAP